MLQAFRLRRSPAPDHSIILVWWVLAILWLTLTIGAMAVITPYSIILFAALPFLFLVLSPKAGLVTYLTVTIWQNLVIGIWSPHIPPELFQPLQGVNFVITAGFGIFSFLTLLLSKSGLTNGFARKAVKMAFWLVVLSLFYLAYGIAVNGFSGAVIYFRNFTWGLFSLATGVYFSKRMDLKTILRIWMVLGAIVLFLAFWEFFFTEHYYDLFNLNFFYALKTQTDGMTSRELIEKLTITFFNASYFKDIGIKSFRMLGSNVHHVSFAYLLSFLVFVFTIERKYLLAATAFCLILIIGAKGATLLTALSLGLTYLFRARYSGSLRNFTVVALCTALTVALLTYGTMTGDYHVMGLMGGINSFIENPLGHGFGFGGNLAAGKTIDWQQAQLLGAAPYGLESSVGVLLCQWGIGGVLYLFFILWIWKSLLYSLKRHGALHTSGCNFSLIYVALGFISVSLVFQEEALSPYAIGFEMLWIGLISDLVRTTRAPNAPPQSARR